jgi:hypothetical protein
VIASSARSASGGYTQKAHTTARRGRTFARIATINFILKGKSMERSTIQAPNIASAAFQLYKMKRMDRLLHNICGIPPMDNAQQDTRGDFVDLSEQTFSKDKQCQN